MKRIATLALALTAFTAIQAQSVVSLVEAPAQNYTPLNKLQADEYLPNTLILNVLPQHRAVCSNEYIGIPAVQQFFQMVGVDHVEKMFPLHKAPEKATNAQGQKLVDLSLIYTVHYSSAYDLERAIGKLYHLGYFEYVEPYFIPKAEFTPNDPQATSALSYHIYKIAAASTSGTSGWDISTGSASIVIGITDTGVELTHSDLTNQIAYNAADPINGSDDDNDGYIDNYRGWDVAMNDNDPTWQANAHGVHVSGCAAAQVNNNIGVAGAGFNCKFLPVKIGDAAGNLTASYQGIVYAADHGCAVINCSWGGTGGGSFGQSVVDYATFNQDALVVAASGNSSADQAFFPAAFDNVLSVSSTSSNDIKSGFSNWNYTVDICAPGSNINATWTGNSYTQSSGTSMASPVCAGAAAIVRAYYPAYTALQAGERLKMTADNIYFASNVTYQDKLGTGRVNLYRALTDPAGPSVLYENRISTDNNDNVFVANDTLRMTGDFHNYLNATTNLTATLSVVVGGAYVTILDGTTNPGVIATNAMVGHNVDPFQVKINANAPQNSLITFKLTLTDGSWTYNQYFSETVNVDYINITVNDVWTTVTSKGLIGYNADQQQQGLGFNYQQNGSLLYEAGLMIGNSGTKVNDVVRGTGATPDAEFGSVQTVRQTIPAVVADFDAWGVFNDAPAASQLPVRVTHSAYAWSAAPHNKYVIFQYVIKNTGASTLSTLYAGIFADWDIDASTFGENRANYDAALKMGYVFYTANGGKYCGIKLLTNTAPPVHYAIDNVTGGAGGIDPVTGQFDTNEKYTTLSTNRPQAGVAGNGADVLDVMSSGPFTIAAGDSVIVAFALLAGDNLADLQVSAADAQVQYDNQVPLGISMTTSPNAPTMSDVFPNPTNGNTAIAFNLPEASQVNMNLFDATGRQVSMLASGSMGAGVHTVQFDASGLAEGIYICRFEANGVVITRKIMITH